MDITTIPVKQIVIFAILAVIELITAIRICHSRINETLFYMLNLLSICFGCTGITAILYTGYITVTCTNIIIRYVMIAVIITMLIAQTITSNRAEKYYEV